MLELKLYKCLNSVYFKTCLNNFTLFDHFIPLYFQKRSQLEIPTKGTIVWFCLKLSLSNSKYVIIEKLGTINEYKNV